MLSDRIAVVRELEPLVATLVETLTPVADCWQPSDALPAMGDPDWRDGVEELRAEAARLSDETLVVLVGSVVTEEALPSYLAALNRLGGMADTTGTETHAWARWGRAWTAEEKRHGEVTRSYLLLSGRVDMRCVEVTIQHLLRNGFDTRADGDPYRGLAYVAFQEHATKVSWSRVGRLAGDAGAARLRRICGLVAADEARHERVYVSVLREVVRRDPAGSLCALEETLCREVVMPARTMTDGVDAGLFAHFAEVGKRAGVYTLGDYAENLAQLVETLGLARLSGLPPDAEAARDAICARAAVCARAALHEASAIQRGARPARPVPFGWIHGRRA